MKRVNPADDVAGSPKRKAPVVTTAGEQQSVKTTLFVLGHKPFKAVVFLPQLSRFSTKTVKQALAQLDPDKDLPHFPQGHFEHVHNSAGGQVVLFRHDNVVGCQNTGSTQHAQLPVPVKRHKERLSFTREPQNLRVGFEYLFGYSHAYTISERGEILLSQSLPPSAVEKLTENERTINMVKTLEKHYSSSNVNIRGLSRNSSHYCPFSGGGDIQLFVQAGIIRSCGDYC